MNSYIIMGALLIAFAAGAALGYFYSESKTQTLILAQQKTDQSTCEKAQQITKDENNALQTNTNAIANEFKSYKLQHTSACMYITKPSRISSNGAKHADNNGDGLSSDWLLNYAATAETYRTEVNVCTDFLAQERKILQPQP